MILTVRPLSDRTAFRGQHTPSKFGVTYAATLDLLGRELGFLKARDVVLEVDVSESQISLAGAIRADAVAASPGVRLAFESNQGPLVYATDRFVRGDATVYIGSERQGNRRVQRTMAQSWQHNVYAIAKSLEALRLVDRYGVTGAGEQYAGFKQLGAGRAMPASHMTASDARALLAKIVGPFDRSPDDAERFRRARLAAHPDRNEGDRALWDQVEVAGKVLGLI